MPLYELLCLAKPALPRSDLVRMMQRVGEVVMDRGGVLTDVRSYGEQHLAYDVRRPFEKYSKAHIWQMNFMVAPEVLRVVNHELGVDRGVLRWMCVKRADKVTLGTALEAASRVHEQLAEVAEAAQDQQQQPGAAAEERTEPPPPAAQPPPP